MYQIFAIIFYILLFSFLISKLFVVICVRRNRFNEKYKELKKKVKNDILSKKVFKLLIIVIIIVGVYITLSIILGLGFLMFGLIAGFFGFVSLDNGAWSNPFDVPIVKAYYAFITKCFSLFKYVPFAIYIIIYIFLVRLIIINILSYKEILKESK